MEDNSISIGKGAAGEEEGEAYGKKKRLRRRSLTRGGMEDYI